MASSIQVGPPQTPEYGDEATTAPGGASGRSDRRFSPTSRRLLIDGLVLIVVALIAGFTTKTFVAQMFVIPSLSMQNTLTSGDRIIVEKLSYLAGSPRAGDIVVFDGSGIFSAPAPGATIFVKRVVGVGGDQVVCCDASGRVMVGGVGLDESAYLKGDQVPSESRFDVTVPADSLWVMGDNREGSADSRSYIDSPGGGFIPTARVVGRAIVVAWPLSSARWIG